MSSPHHCDTTIDPHQFATTPVSNNKDDGIHIMGTDEEGVEVIVGVRWNDLDISGDFYGTATKLDRTFVC